MYFMLRLVNYNNILISWSLVLSCLRSIESYLLIVLSDKHTLVVMRICGKFIDESELFYP